MTNKHLKHYLKANRFSIPKPASISSSQSRSLFWHEQSAHVRFFQFKKVYLLIYTSGIPCKAPVRTDYSMTRNYYGDGIVSDCAAYGLRRHLINASLLCNLFSDLSIRHSFSIRDRQHYLSYGFSERRSFHRNRRSEIRLPATEIYVEPAHRLLKYRQ